MPSEITLGENMRVRCRGRVLRIVKAKDTSLEIDPTAAEGQVSETNGDQDRRGRLLERL